MPVNYRNKSKPPQSHHGNCLMSVLLFVLRQIQTQHTNCYLWSCHSFSFCTDYIRNYYLSFLYFCRSSLWEKVVKSRYVIQQKQTIRVLWLAKATRSNGEEWLVCRLLLLLMMTMWVVDIEKNNEKFDV